MTARTGGVLPFLLVAATLTLAVAQDTPPGPPPPKSEGAATPPPAAPEFQPPAILAQRRKGLKEKTATAAVAAGLDWLRRHQARDGRWDCDGFGAGCTGARCDGPGMSVFDPGATGLAVLAFLGSGATQVEGADAALLSKSLAYLIGVQDSGGCLGTRTSAHCQYNHYVATMAVADALWLTGDERLIGPATRARDFLITSQNPYLAWRYGVREGDNDTSNAAYAVVALRACAFAGLAVPDGAWTGARDWFDRMTDRAEGRTGYQNRGGLDARAWLRDPPPDPSRPTPPPDEGSRGGISTKPAPLLFPEADPLQTDARLDGPSGEPVGRVPVGVIAKYPDRGGSALTAAAAAATSLTCGADAAELMDCFARTLSNTRPGTERAGFLDLHRLLFGSLFHAQRPFDVRPVHESARKTWRPWRDAVVSELVASQRTRDDGCAAGSWDADRDPFGVAGGRVYATAMAVLALESPNRFPRVWNPRAKPARPSGTEKK